MRMNTRKLTVVWMLALTGICGVGDTPAQDAVLGETIAERQPVEETMSSDESGIPEGYMIIEGDIIVPEDFYDGRGTYRTNLWTNGIVPYEFDANVTAANQSAMLGAMAVWETGTNIDFVARASQPDYLLIQDNTVSNSWIGMQGGAQIVNIANWNTANSTMVHELGHALGYWHEQKRSDRDSFIQIEWANIEFGHAHNFDIYPIFPPASGEYGPYDFGSIMHYGACDWSNCQSCTCSDSSCRTITVLPPNDVAWQCSLNQGLPPSFWDIRVMSFLYPQPGWRFVDGTWTGAENGTVYEPYQTALLGLTSTPSGGTLWIDPGDYLAAGTWSSAVTLQAPLGGVSLGIGG